MTTTISLDCMGGDFGPQVVVPAALSVLNKHDDIQLILVGDRETIEEQLTEINSLKEQLAGTNKDLENVTIEKNNMSFLGIIPMKKAARTIVRSGFSRSFGVREIRART